MTKAEAYREHGELMLRIYSWPYPQRAPATPYMSAVIRRQNALYGYWRFDEPAPCEREDWECPPRDVEETIENYWLRNARTESMDDPAFLRFWEKYGGKYPPVPEWTEELERNFGGRR